MAVTGGNGEDRLVQKTFADYLRDRLGWDGVCAFNAETFGADSLLGRADTTEAVLKRDLRAALQRLNPALPAAALDDAPRKLTAQDFSRSTIQHNRDFHRLLRNGVPVE
jgi:type I restriction enzyme, R subunit